MHGTATGADGLSGVVEDSDIYYEPHSPTSSTIPELGDRGNKAFDRGAIPIQQTFNNRSLHKVQATWHICVSQALLNC
jgi:hypothetical protein